jgi:D-arabinose 1-dehydrogenase-like Zn-dependent alcohol dehydrogenase
MQSYTQRTGIILLDKYKEHLHMRAMAVVDYSAPLRLLDLPQPELQPGYVLVRVLACGVCYTDVKISRGRMTWSSEVELPHVPGHEVSAVVVEAGPDTGFVPGERVLVYNYWSCGRCPSCLIGRETLCESLEGWVGFATPGGFQEFLSVRADRLVRVPDGIKAEEVCAASCALGTGYRAVATRGRVQPGEVVVIIGAGGVGLHALQIARESGAHVLAVDVDRRKLEVASQLGANGVALAGEEAEALVRDYTAGRGADMVIDIVGHGDTLEQAAKMLRRAGRVVGVGYVPAGFSRFPTDVFVLQEKEFIGTRYAHRYEIERVLSMMAEGRIKPIIDAIRPLEEAEEALQSLERGEVVGRTVLRVSEAD